MDVQQTGLTDGSLICPAAQDAHQRLLPGQGVGSRVTASQDSSTQGHQVEHAAARVWPTAAPAGCRDYAKKYKIKHFYDITDRSDFKANPNYKGVCHIAMAQEGHCLPGVPFPTAAMWCTCHV